MKELIEWHEYLQEKPEEVKAYLVECKFEKEHYFTESIYFGDIAGFGSRGVIAWAEKPKGINATP